MSDSPQIIKVTRYYVNYHRSGSVLRKGQFVYGVYRGGEWDVIPSPRGHRFMQRARDILDNQRAQYNGWSFAPGEDEYEFVSENEVPDEVWVAFAKEALMVGEEDDEDR